jgi:hypothetical protein
LGLATVSTCWSVQCSRHPSSQLSATIDGRTTDYTQYRRQSLINPIEFAR